MTIGSRVRARYDLYRGQSPGQTLGPYFHQGLIRTQRWFQVPDVCRDEADVFDGVLIDDTTPGERVRVEGVVYDGARRPVTDALLEVWQADAQGHYLHRLDAGEPPPGSRFRGFGRTATSETGSFAFVTIKPGSVLGPEGTRQAPHLNLLVAGRGMARHAFSRIYFEGDDDLERDAVLALVPAARRVTLIAQRTGAPAAVTTYRFDIHLQGEHETVFFEL